MINCINHIGIGVNDIDKSYPFYRQHLNFTFKMSDDQYPIWELEPMFKRKPVMRLHNSMNPIGGPALELFQHIDTAPQKRVRNNNWNDIGILELGIRVQGIESVCKTMIDDGVNIITDIDEIVTVYGQVWKTAYLRTPDDVLIQLIDMEGSISLGNKKRRVCGINHVGLGVSNIERALDFYSNWPGFDEVVYHDKDAGKHLGEVMPNGKDIETLLLSRSEGSTSKLSCYDGGMIKLINHKAGEKKKVFEGRRFGDIGITEIGLEVDDVRETFKSAIESGGRPLVPPTEFDLKFGPCGTLAYLEDLDGNVIELVYLKSLFKLPPKMLDYMVIRPLRFLGKLGLA